MRDERALEAALVRLDRRGFLRATGLAAAAGLLPSGCGGVAPELEPPPGARLQVLTPRTYATFTAAAGVLLGPRARAAAEAAEVDLALRADARMDGMPSFAGLVGQALLALEFGVHPLVPKWRPFTALAPEARAGVLAGLATARLGLSRALFQGVRSFAWLTWYAAPESHAAIHYPAPFGRGAVRIEEAMVYAGRGAAAPEEPHG